MPNADQVKAAIRALMSAGGFLYVYLANKGVAPDQINVLQDLAIQFAPPLLALGWSFAEKTHNAVIAKAATLIGPTGKIIVSAGAPAGATAAAVGDASPNVKLGSSPWAVALGVALILPMLVGACGTNSAGQPTIAGSLTVPGTSVSVADVAQQVSQQCAKKAPTDALLNGIALAAGASPGISLGLMTAEAIGGLACGYLATTTAAPTTAPALPAPVPAAAPVAATGG